MSPDSTTGDNHENRAVKQNEALHLRIKSSPVSSLYADGACRFGSLSGQDDGPGLRQ